MPEHDWVAMVREFHLKYHRPVRDRPTSDLPWGEVAEGIRLLDEEAGELSRAMAASNLDKIADGIGDTLYVVLGLALQYGIDPSLVLEAVHRSNLTRELPSDDSAREGKVPRGAEYVPPDLNGVIE